MRKQKVTAYLDARLADDMQALAARRRVPTTRIVEAAIASFLSPDGAEQSEAAITRRLDRMTRAIERLERDQEIAGEALALFIRFWLAATPPIHDELRDAAQAKGKERYAGFVDALARRLAKGTTLSREVSREVSGRATDA